MGSPAGWSVGRALRRDPHHSAGPAGLPQRGVRPARRARRARWVGGRRRRGVLAHGQADVRDQRVFRIGLAQQHADAGRVGLLAVAVVGGGDHDHRQLRGLRVGADVARELEAVHAGHLHVGDEHVGQLRLHLLHGVEPVVGIGHLVLVLRQQAAGLDAHDLGVVGHQHQGLRRGLDWRGAAAAARSAAAFGCDARSARPGARPRPGPAASRSACSSRSARSAWLRLARPPRGDARRHRSASGVRLRPRSRARLRHRSAFGLRARLRPRARLRALAPRSASQRGLVRALGFAARPRRARLRRASARSRSASSCARALGLGSCGPLGSLAARRQRARLRAFGLLPAAWRFASALGPRSARSSASAAAALALGCSARRAGAAPRLARRASALGLAFGLSGGAAARRPALARAHRARRRICQPTSRHRAVPTSSQRR